MKVRWEHVSDTAAVAYQKPVGRLHGDVPRAWVSVALPEDLHRCMLAVERALDPDPSTQGDTP